jgi:hypothetical protein
MESWSATAEKRQWPSGLIYRVYESERMCRVRHDPKILRGAAYLMDFEA